MGNDNQVVLVTGTSSGLGAAISNALLEKRWKVIGISRRSKAALRHAGMTLAAELESAEHPGGPRLNASIMGYSPGVVDTSMQETARSTGHPWFKIFEDLHARGQLNPPEMPARDVVEFLAGNSKELFVEKRFGTTS
jgi:NAD(P)-dependent dehydrogenase (short-subunit alcohol dehydrogenase family)